MYTKLLSLDTSATLALSTLFPHTLTTNTLAYVLSGVGSTILVWALVICIVFIWEYHIRKNKRVFLAQLSKLMLTLAVTLSLAFVSTEYVMKPTWQRPRPYQIHRIDAPHCPNSFSFPSGHATLAFAGAYILWRFDHHKGRRLTYVLIAIGISYSRIYLLCHYVGDVAAGALYGIVVGAVSYTLIHALFTRAKRAL